MSETLRQITKTIVAQAFLASQRKAQILVRLGYLGQPHGSPRRFLSARQSMASTPSGLLYQRRFLGETSFDLTGQPARGEPAILLNSFRPDSFSHRAPEMSSVRSAVALTSHDRSKWRLSGAGGSLQGGALIRRGEGGDPAVT
jgi:hypothetical protein